MPTNNKVASRDTNHGTPSSRLALLGSAVLGLSPALAPAQEPDGEEIFTRACASCHINPAPETRAPDFDTLRRFAPEAVLTSLMTGRMFRQGSALSDAERVAVSGYTAGRAVGTAAPPLDVGLCTSEPHALTAADLTTGWNGWGGDVTNTRFRSAELGGLTAADLPKLELKWAFGFPGVNAVRTQVTVVGGRVFIGTEAGDLFALDAKTGCSHWSYHAQAGVRAAVSVGPYRAADGRAGYAAYFADQLATAYAVDADTGEEIWRRRVDNHTYASATGSPTLYGGRLYVVTSAVGEEGQGGNATYPCCTFRGSVTALDGNTGEVVWQSFMLPAPERRGTSTEGQPLWGPAGGGIWAAPTIDAARQRLYVATGNAYAAPAHDTTDAIVALDLADGERLWTFQPLANDVWAGGCGRRGGNPNCPEALGPDHDFSMPPLLVRGADGNDILIATQKSAIAYGVDAATGRKLWEYRVGQASGLGGQWGMAADAERTYVGVKQGGVRAIALASGAEAWTAGADERLCGSERGCSAGQGAAATAIPGAVILGSMDGGIRAYASASGEMIWRYDTNRSFETVNGVEANGGAMDGHGAAVVDGMLYMSSGYISLIGRPGNVLLAFGLE